MSLSPMVRVAAKNNAEWCNAFCRTHGIVGCFRADAWLSEIRTPRYYPDAVTLVAHADVNHILGRIDTSEGCSIKDSFACLDLGPAGFRPLFSAEWLARDPPGPGDARTDDWSFLITDEQLERWEAAWAQSALAEGFFRRGLLAAEAIGILAGYEDERIVAGAIANRSATVIGLSNVFAVDDLEAAWRAAAAVATARWGDMRLVGYDSGASLNAARDAGFASIGELVIWTNTPTPPSPASERTA
jgi:hypothetical protein